MAADRDGTRGAGNLFAEVRATIKRRHLSPRAEEAYLGWIRRFMAFHRWRHPVEMGSEEVVAFLTDLAVRKHLSASSQNQALNAVVFLFKRVLKRELGDLSSYERAKRPERLPAVPSAAEVAALLAHLREPYLLVAELMYGSGLRLQECLSLRVKDIDFDRRQIVVREGKGDKDRVTLLPDRCRGGLEQRIELIRRSFVRAGTQPGTGTGTGAGSGTGSGTGRNRGAAVRSSSMWTLICRRRWRGSIPGRRDRWRGSSCFRRRNPRGIPTRGGGCSTTCTTVPFSERLRRGCGRPGSTDGSRVMA